MDVMFANSPSQANCCHGAGSEVARRAAESVAFDVQIIKENSKPGKVDKKAYKRVYRCISRLGGDDDSKGKTIILAELHAWVAEELILRNFDAARCFAARAIEFQAFFGHKEVASFVDVYSTTEQCATDRGLIWYTSQHLPCKCLDLLKEEYQNYVQTALCASCRKTLPVNQLIQCQHCKVEIYCSQECQTKRWPRHEKWCQEFARRRASKLEAEAKKEATVGQQDTKA